MGMKGIVASSAGLSLLLAEGIGDTIRVSITPEPRGDRTEEVAVAQQVLQSLGLRSFMPQVSSCPGCGRTTSTYFQELARDIQTYLRDQMPVWRERHPGVEELRVAVMGCVVNGPGESKHADIGISLPGTFEEPVAPVFIDGALDRTLRGDHIVDGVQGDPGSVCGAAVPDAGGAALARLSSRCLRRRRCCRLQRPAAAPRGPATRRAFVANSVLDLNVSVGDSPAAGSILSTPRQPEGAGSCAGRDSPLVRRSGPGGTIARSQRGWIVRRRNSAQRGFRHQHHPPVRGLPGLVQRRRPEG